MAKGLAHKFWYKGYHQIWRISGSLVTSCLKELIRQLCSASDFLCSISAKPKLHGHVAQRGPCLACPDLAQFWLVNLGILNPSRAYIINHHMCVEIPTENLGNNQVTTDPRGTWVLILGLFHHISYHTSTVHHHLTKRKKRRGTLAEWWYHSNNVHYVFIGCYIVYDWNYWLYIILF